MGMTVEEQLKQVTREGRNTAPVHCDIQLLTYFLRPGAPKCVHYFGCSKKSCWLCWHMMVQNSQFSMKDSHRKIYPRWALPSELTLSHTNFVEGLKIAYNEMLSLLQHKVIQRTNLESHGLFLQSSARITPWHLNYELSPWAFSGNNIAAPHSEQMLLDRIPALYIPQDDSLSDVRNVIVSIIHLQINRAKCTVSHNVEFWQYRCPFCFPVFDKGLERLIGARRVSNYLLEQQYIWRVV
ncbi:hypothetical protein F4678DRAFT_159762 [Xylaria arbuscula]|nr:hypothetical protein F4678DRAFT_159762 [Xylaria arbuscula]